MHAPVLLQDLPAKTMHRLLKSVTWTEVDAVSPAKTPLRRVIGLIGHSGLRSVNLRNPDLLLKFRRAIAWLRGYS
jgi:hypothetical protein